MSAEKLELNPNYSHLFESYDNLSSSDSRELAHSMTQAGMEQLNNNVLYGEEIAKKIYLGTLIMGSEGAMATLFTSIPGQGKSTLLEKGIGLLGIDPSEVANIPPRSDMTEKKLIGSIDKLLIKTTKDNVESLEEINIETPQLIREGIRLLNFDELNRLNPVAMNSILEILQKGYISIFDKQGKLQKLNKFDAVFAALNPQETMATNRLDGALKSRFAWGAVLGRYNEGELSPSAEAKLFGRFKPGEASPIISQDNLSKIRNGIDRVNIPNAQLKLMGKLIVKSRDILDQYGSPYGDNRTVEQVLRIARVLSMMGNNEYVTEENVIDAVIYNFIPKYALLAETDENGKPIDPLIFAETEIAA